MRFAAAFACAVMLTCLGAMPSYAEKRVALVVGNDRYANLPADQQLRKAVNDARAVGDALTRLGFEVIRGENLGRQALVDKFEELTGRLAPGDTAFFFFAGHGVAIGGGNYILPVDVPSIEAGQDMRLARASLGENDIVSDLQGRGVRVAVVVLDACRNNPFKKPGVRGVGAERGLGRIEPVRGVFTLYSAGIGQMALDRLGDTDNNPNSVFTRVFVPALIRPGLGLGDLAVEVREEVSRLAASVRHDQRPAYYDETIGGRVYLAGLPREEPKLPIAQSLADPAAQAWATVKDTTSVLVLEAFIKRYGDSFYADIARARLDELKKVVVVVPPVAPSVPAGPCGKAPLIVSWSTRAAQPLSGAEECALKPKDVFKECDKCPEMVVVPAGSFTMGSPASEAGRYDNEGPQHPVTIGKPFAVGKFQVTFDQFAAFVAETGYDAGSKCYAFEEGKWKEKQGLSWRTPGFAQKGSHPAVCLNWNDANAYVAWLAKQTGKSYRLLTEAQWEYAARAGTTTRYFFGDEEKVFCRYGNGADQTAKSKILPCSDGYAYTAPVGSFLPNGFGLYDMHGNAWQWLEDCWHENYQGAPSGGSAWISGDCSRRVVRGGSWYGGPGELRSAIRFGDSSVYRYYGSGFRLGRTLSP
jgi:formylglycine-generating enzyme required for sulfatase activity